MSDSEVHDGFGDGRVLPQGGKTSDAVYYSRQQLRRAREFLSRLYAACRAMRLYPAEHSASRAAVSSLAESVGAYHAEGVDLEIAFHEGEILLGNQLLPEESVLFDQLVRELTSIGAGSLVIERGVSADELGRLVELLCADPAAVESVGGVATMAGAMGLERVKVFALSGVEQTRADAAEVDMDPKATYGRAVSLLREIERFTRLNRSVPAAKIDGVVRSLVDNVLTHRHPMLQLAGLKDYDEYTYYHSANVAILSLVLGSAISTDPRFLSSLGAGGLLHDIGKLSIDTSLLNKPGAPTPEEWEELCRHPTEGAQRVSQMPGIDRTAVVAVLEHHMRYDGTGYPRRVPQRPQHLASRIVAVADSYDAMTSHRSYSAARTQNDAMLVLAEGAGTLHDPTLVRLFIASLGVYPPRSVVRLSSGELAVVLQPDPYDTMRPVVRIIADGAGHLVEPTDLALATRQGTSIQGCIDPAAAGIEVDDFI